VLDEKEREKSQIEGGNRFGTNSKRQRWKGTYCADVRDTGVHAVVFSVSCSVFDSRIDTRSKEQLASHPRLRMTSLLGLCDSSSAQKSEDRERC